MNIDNDVPLPGKQAKWSALFDKMEVGHSILVESREEAERICGSAYAYGKYYGNGFRMIRRKTAEGYRIWRAE